MKKITLLFLFLGFISSLYSQSLFDAATKGDEDLATRLIKGGADPNNTNNTGSSPLILACRFGHLNVVRVLLNNGAKIEEPKTPKGRTPLMVACAYSSGITIIKLLVEKGANINATANDKSTPLMLAARMAKADVVEYLVSKGADVNAKDASGLTALDYARTWQYIDRMDGTIGDTKIDSSAVITKLKSPGTK